MATSKRELEDIDESLLLSSIKEKDTPREQTIQSIQSKVTQRGESEKPKEVKEPLKHKRTTTSDYISIFLQKNEFKTRQCVYISGQVHTTISEIVRVIADKDVTVGGYIDNVLLQHLEAHKDEINELYKKDRENLIE
jgi:hypothetical protein